MKELKYLIIHCTATKEGKDITGEDIRRFHTSPPPQGRGWNQVGYSELIRLDGTVETLVNYNEDNWVQAGEITNGAKEYNSCSRHICYVGGVDKDMKPNNTMTTDQYEAIEAYIKRFLYLHPTAIVIGHNMVTNAKACPSFDVYAEFGHVIPKTNRKK